MITIDGSYGEGGGQIVRTGLALAALTGQALRLENIRARRKNPGLAAQHLTAVRAAAQVCRAEVEGDALGSRTLIFRPTASPQPGHYVFDVREARQGGSAGAVSLVFQTLFLPLAHASGDSHVTLRGGTHVPWSPPVHYLMNVYLPTLARLGYGAELELVRWGWYPAGGGEMRSQISPLTSNPLSQSDVIPSPFTPFRASSSLRSGSEQALSDSEGSGRGNEGGEGHQPLSHPVGEGAQGVRAIDWTGRGELKRVWGVAAVSNLPAHIPQRMADRARRLLEREGIHASIETQRESGPGIGAGIFLFAEYEKARAGFSALGEKGKPSEKVAEEACHDLLAHHASGYALDMHLADQVVLPLALSGRPATFTTCRITPHLLTVLHVVGHFLDLGSRVEGEEGGPGQVWINFLDSSG